MKGPFDGKLTKYQFGGGPDGRDHYNQWEIKAESLDKAILRFRVGCMFPFRCADKKWWIMRETVDEDDYERVEDVVGAKPGATLNVYVWVDGDAKVVATIPVETDEVIIDPRMLLPPQAMEVLESTSEVTAIELSRQPQALQGLQTADRREVTRRALELELTIKKLEMEKYALKQQVEKLHAEISERLKRIWVIELYVGSHETVVQLAQGVPASVDEPITVRQRALCMDEEIAVWAWHHRPELLDKQKGFNYNNIEDFDQWLVEDASHLDQVLPEHKSVVAIRIRRNPRRRDGSKARSICDIMSSIAEDEADRKTYLLIRNGENVYRLWVDTVIWPRFFPRRDELDLAKRKEKDRWHEVDEKKIREEMQHYMCGLVVLQGLLDRSTLFQPLPNNGKINVFDPDHAERYLRLIRDDESALVADTSILSWREYQEWLKTQLRVGARILYCGDRYGSGDDKLKYRTGINSVSGWPMSDEVYVVDADCEKGSWRGDWFEFLYNPYDDIYEKVDKWGSRVYDPHERQKRVRFRAYEGEIVPIDAISTRYLDYLINDRSQRENYTSSFMMLRHWKRIRDAEEAHEAPFVDLVLSQAGLDSRDPANTAELQRCRRLVRWWKLKTKVGRTLEADEPKALRMVLAAFKRDQDYDGDPELGLPAPAHIKSAD